MTKKVKHSIIGYNLERSKKIDIHNMKTEELLSIIENFNNTSLKVYKIPVKDGILKISVENNIPKITYLTEKQVLINHKSNNCLELITI